MIYRQIHRKTPPHNFIAEKEDNAHGNHPRGEGGWLAAQKNLVNFKRTAYKILFQNFQQNDCTETGKCASVVRPNR